MKTIFFDYIALFIGLAALVMLVQLGAPWFIEPDSLVLLSLFLTAPLIYNLVLFYFAYRFFTGIVKRSREYDHPGRAKKYLWVSFVSSTLLILLLFILGTQCNLSSTGSNTLAFVIMGILVSYMAFIYAQERIEDIPKEKEEVR